MTDEENITFSFVKTMPAMAPIYKERLYDFIVSLGLDPHDETVFPKPTYLTVGIHPLGSDDPLCHECAVEFLENHTQGESDPFHHTKQEVVYDTPICCELCDRKLQATIRSKASATSIIEWTVDTFREGKELSDGDWYDLWASLEFLDYDDDFWDFIGYILVECGDLNNACRK